MNLSAQTIWIAVGFAGQALFSARFLIQWIATLFAYAVWREDPVFMVGQGFGLIVYVRNLLLIRRERDNQSQDEKARDLGPPDPPPQH
ncbi:MAG: hypothetical protein EBS61_04985 [Betaproteobacteria bacterium]|nr:hypothetical protein [Betaproteobacteria bacterium]